MWPEFIDINGATFVWLEKTWNILHESTGPLLLCFFVILVRDSSSPHSLSLYEKEQQDILLKFSFYIPQKIIWIQYDMSVNEGENFNFWLFSQRENGAW